MKTILSFLIMTALHICSMAQNTWVQKSQLTGPARLGAVGFSIGTKGYIGTGYNGSVYKDFWEWDPGTNLWTQKANIPIARAWAEGFSIGTKGYIGVGSDGTLNFKDFWEWDQNSNVWTQKADFGGGPTSETAAFSIGAYGYITGQTGDLWEYNPGTDTWLQKASYPGAGPNSPVSFSIGTKGYIGTGSTNTSFEEDFWEWDQSTNIWTQKANYPGGVRNAGAAFAMGGLGYVGTGADAHYNYHKDFWAFNPLTNAWTQIATFPGTGRWVDLGFAMGSKGYIGCGFDASGERKDFWEYTPSPAGIEELSETTVNVFPNPCITSSTFELSKELGSAYLKLIDICGKEVRDVRFTGKQFLLQRENLPAGLYTYLIIVEGKKVISGKLSIH